MCRNSKATQSPNTGGSLPSKRKGPKRDSNLICSSKNILFLQTLQKHMITLSKHDTARTHTHTHTLNVLPTIYYTPAQPRLVEQTAEIQWDF